MTTTRDPLKRLASDAKWRKLKAAVNKEGIQYIEREAARAVRANRPSVSKAKSQRIVQRRVKAGKGVGGSHGMRPLK